MPEHETAFTNLIPKHKTPFLSLLAAELERHRHTRILGGYFLIQPLRRNDGRDIYAAILGREPVGFPAGSPLCHAGSVAFQTFGPAAPAEWDHGIFVLAAALVCLHRPAGCLPSRRECGRGCCCRRTVQRCICVAAQKHMGILLP